MAIHQWAAVIASLMPLAACPVSEARKHTREPTPVSWDAPAGTTGPISRYYVSTRGSDSSSGQAGAPFRTIQRAADLAGPGDTVFVAPGTYTGGERIVSVTRSGTTGNPITFLSERRWEAVLDGQNGRSSAGWYFGPAVGHVKVEGFELRDLEAHGFDFYGGGVHDVLIARNQVHHIGRNCTDTRNGRTGASLGDSARRITFDGNVWHHIGRFAPGEQGCAPRTEYYKNHDHGIYVADADQILIRNNVFYGFARGWPVQRYSSASRTVHGLVIVNNTFSGRNPYREGHIILASPTAGLRIENNIFQGPNTAALNFEDLRFSGAVIRYNLVQGAALKIGNPRGASFSRNRENTDPKLGGAPDFRLRYDSPAIDAGVPLSEVPHDADGAPRPRGTGFDLGAYER